MGTTLRAFAYPALAGKFGQMSTTPKRAEMSERVQTVFKELFDGLESMKQQQWKITNYAILLLAAAFALRDKTNLYAFLSIVWTTTGLGSLLLLSLQWNLGRYRKRIDGLHKAYFTKQELIDIGLNESEQNRLGRKTQFELSIRGWEFVSALIAVLIGGSLLISFAY